MNIVAYDDQGYPIQLAKLVWIGNDHALFQKTNPRFDQIFSKETEEGYWELIPMAISAVPVRKETEVLTPQSEIDNWGKNVDEPQRSNKPMIEEEAYLDKARRLVFEYVSARFDRSDPEVKFTMGDVYVVWFCKTLKNWKALVSTELADQMYYEVTYDGEHKQAYIDVYKRFDHTCVQDLPRRLAGLGMIPAGKDRFA